MFENSNVLSRSAAGICVGVDDLANRLSFLSKTGSAITATPAEGLARIFICSRWTARTDADGMVTIP